MHIALARCSSSSDIGANLDTTESLIVSAAGEGAQIVALQELFHTPYFCREVDPKHFELAEPVPGPLTERLCRIAASHQVVIVAPMFERQAAGLYFNKIGRASCRERVSNSATAADGSRRTEADRDS